MIPPASDEVRVATLPGWALGLMQLDIPHAVGVPVIDVLYAGAYGPVPHGIVVSEHMSALSCPCCQHLTRQFIGVDYTSKDGHCGSLGSYWVVDLDTERGREHVIAWLKDLVS